MELLEKIQEQKRKEQQQLIDEIKKIIPDAKDFILKGAGLFFYSKGKDKLFKQCVCFYDNRGIKTILKQIDVTKTIRFMINGQPTSNCKVIY